MVLDGSGTAGRMTEHFQWVGGGQAPSPDSGGRQWILDPMSQSRVAWWRRLVAGGWPLSKGGSGQPNPASTSVCLVSILLIGSHLKKVFSCQKSFKKSTGQG